VGDSKKRWEAMVMDDILNSAAGRCLADWLLVRVLNREMRLFSILSFETSLQHRAHNILLYIF